MPVLDAVHDFAHPVEIDEAWSESYYFNGYDPDADVGFFTRIGVRPNEGTIDVGLSVWLPGDRGVAYVRGVREQREMVDDDLEVAGVRYERRAPMTEWRLAADADASVEGGSGRAPDRPGARVAMDVTFRALMPAVGVEGPRPGAGGAASTTSATVGKGHLEQAGRWSGWIEVDGQRQVLGAEARGNRDKSWGPRRWGGPKMWRWFSVNVGDDVAFGGIRIGTPAGDLHRGWVWRDGEATSIRDWKVSSELADDGVTHRLTRVVATDKAGRVHRLEGEILRVHGVHQKPPGADGAHTLVNEGLARWTYEGRTGYGIAEYLHQLDAWGRPAVPID
ncbi:MAG: DUF7064 domain-containing protein [Acidimicrobiales bacterium]